MLAVGCLSRLASASVTDVGSLLPVIQVPLSVLMIISFPKFQSFMSEPTSFASLWLVETTSNS